MNKLKINWISKFKNTVNRFSKKVEKMKKNGWNEDKRNYY